MSGQEAPILHSVAEVCRLTGLGRTTLYEEIRSKRLQSITVGRRRLTPRSAIDDWINGCLAAEE